MTVLPGIGPRIARLVARIAGDKVVDLCWLLPHSLVTRVTVATVAELRPGMMASLPLRVVAHQPPPNRRLPYKIRCLDAADTRLDLVFFHGREDYLRGLLPEGARRLVSGLVDEYRGVFQITHPDYVTDPDKEAPPPAVEAVYPLTAGLAPKTLHKAMAALLDTVPDLPEWIESAHMARAAWPSWKAALLAAHAPAAAAALAPAHPARARLAYDELLANQLALALVRARNRRRAGRRIEGDGHLRRAAAAALPFRLTACQRQAVADIVADMKSPSRMLRLLQGDVGSGKTVVALLAMLNAVEAGHQAALMAPTELLARQHFASLSAMAAPAGVEVSLLTGREKGAARQAVLDRLAAGEIAIIVGTHALFQDQVRFADLALAVIDEQHRFGVHQRLSLAAKGGEAPDAGKADKKTDAADMLVMTATPIPRTLTLSYYGDLDVSRLSEKPPGRQPIDTRVLSLSRFDEVIAGVRRALDGGARVYWICPLVEDSLAVDLAAVSKRHTDLAALFGGHRVGLVHGRMKDEERDRMMAGFAAGEISLLVATTVVEVGVDVPEATVMVIEHAERFGLAQLHQLRGRVGRGTASSTCLLLYQSPLGETARARLEVLRQTDDGFRIAEEDLRLRGAGEVLGTRQSGLPRFRLADLAAHEGLLAAADDDARLILEKDPALKSPRGVALRVLLYLFERDEAVKYATTG